MFTVINLFMAGSYPVSSEPIHMIIENNKKTSALRTSELAVKGVKKAVPSGGTQGIPGSKL